MEITYGVNKESIYKNGILKISGIEWGKKEDFKKIRVAILKKHPGWNITGYYRKITEGK